MRSSIMPSGKNGSPNGDDTGFSNSIPRCVGIVGLGLIGGSLARALKNRAGIECIIAFDRNADSLNQALAEGMVDQVFQLPNLQPDEPVKANFSALSQAEIVFICTPVHTVAELANQISEVCSGLVTDVASTKTAICSAVHAHNFIGGHPMAGSERIGYGASSAGLFENAVYVLCTGENETVLAPDLQEKIRRLETVIRAIGAFPLHLSPEMHDRAVAAISHLPHIVASALTLLVARSDQGALSRLAAGGFRDITRIASSDAGLWTSICLSARPALLPLIQSYRETLAEFADALDQSDVPALNRLFTDAADYRNSLPIDGRGALESLSTLTVYVPDQPGELGKVTTLLGNHGINIRNIRIRDFRTYEGGCLQLLLPDSRQAKDAADLLKESGYEVD